MVFLDTQILFPLVKSRLQEQTPRIQDVLNPRHKSVRMLHSCPSFLVFPVPGSDGLIQTPSFKTSLTRGHRQDPSTHFTSLLNRHCLSSKQRWPKSDGLRHVLKTQTWSSFLTCLHSSSNLHGSCFRSSPLTEKVLKKITTLMKKLDVFMIVINGFKSWSTKWDLPFHLNILDDWQESSVTHLIFYPRTRIIS